MINPICFHFRTIYSLPITSVYILTFNTLPLQAVSSKWSCTDVTWDTRILTHILSAKWDVQVLVTNRCTRSPSHQVTNWMQSPHFLHINHRNKLFTHQFLISRKFIQDTVVCQLIVYDFTSMINFTFMITAWSPAVSFDDYFIHLIIMKYIPLSTFYSWSSDVEN